MASTEEVVRTIVADATPVRRLAPPLLRALAWFGFAVVVVALIALTVGMRADLSVKLENLLFALELLAIATTGATATAAAFCVSLPDRGGAWLLLPVPGALLWILIAGYGGLIDWSDLGFDGLAFGMMTRWLATAVLLSLPLAGSIFILLRHASLFRPEATAAAGCLAVGALTAGGLRISYDFDATLLVLAWGPGLSGLFVTVGCIAGRTLLSLTAHPNNLQSRH